MLVTYPDPPGYVLINAMLLPWIMLILRASCSKSVPKRFSVLIEREHTMLEISADTFKLPMEIPDPT
jgi:hypothetical protein